MYFERKYAIQRVKYKPSLDRGRLQNVDNILAASPMQGILEQIHEVEQKINRDTENFVRESIIEVGIDPDALIETAKLNAHLQLVLNNAMKELERFRSREREGRWKGAGLGDYYCSLCCTTYSGGDEYNYCPHCGAYMKGE